MEIDFRQIHYVKMVSLNQIWLWNDHVPKNTLYKVFLYLFDTVRDEFNHCAMENLYNSATLCRATCNHHKMVLVHGMLRIFPYAYVESRNGQVHVFININTSIIRAHST